MWSKEFPTEEGYYWFFGYLSWYSRKSDPRLFFVTATKLDSGSIMFGSGAHFIRTGAGEAQGYWMKAEMPKLPENFEYEE